MTEDVLSTLDELREFVQERVEEIGKEFTEPDDDWISVAFLRGPEGTVVMGLAGEMFENDETKDALAYFLKEAMDRFSAVRYAVVFNTYAARNVSDEDMARVRAGEVRVRELESAQEMLLLVVGDAEQEDSYSSEIHRDGVGPPTLGEWTKSKGTEGRFAKLNERMRLVR